MVKLYGEELDKALKRRNEIKKGRKARRLTLAKGAKILGKELGMSPSEYMEFESGYDVCPHEAFRTIWAGCPPKIFIDQCLKCGFSDNVRNIDDEEAFKDFMKSYPNGFEPVFEEWKEMESSDELEWND